MQENCGNPTMPPRSPEESLGANELLAILAREGIANESEGLLENLSNLDFPAPKVEEGGPEPCPRVTTPLPLVPSAPDDMFLDSPRDTGANLENLPVDPTLPPQEAAVERRSTGGSMSADYAPPQEPSISRSKDVRRGVAPQRVSALELQLCGPDNCPEMVPAGATSGELPSFESVVSLSTPENVSSLDITLISDETLSSSSPSLVQIVQNELSCAPKNGHSAISEGGGARQFLENHEFWPPP